MTFLHDLIMLSIWSLILFLEFNLTNGVDRIGNYADPKNLETCCRGDLSDCFLSCADDAEGFLIKSSLELILYSNFTGAVMLRKIAKSLNSSALPPLAVLHMNGQDCGGLGDLFYVSAIMIQSLSSSSNLLHLPKDKLLSYYTQLITLLSDSGLHRATEVHLESSLSLYPNDMSLLFKSLLATPAVFESLQHLSSTRAIQKTRLRDLLQRETIEIEVLDEFVLSPTFYFIYQGYNDKDFLVDLHHAYARAHPILHSVQVDGRRIHHPPERINIGFVSHYFRRHSVCKLFCGVINNLDPALYNVYVFSTVAKSSEDSYTMKLRENSPSSVKFVSIGSTFVDSRREVVDRNVDILVYLDIGMEPSTVVWAAAKLAPVQVCLWGHPSTTGLQSMDFFVSSDSFHLHDSLPTAQDRFSEQLVRFDSLGFYFAQPLLEPLQHLKLTSQQDYITHLALRPESFYVLIISYLLQQQKQQQKSAITTKTVKTAGSTHLLALLERKSAYRNGQYDQDFEEGKGEVKLILCPQHLPKLHPLFDDILLQSLIRNPLSVAVLIEQPSKHQWRRTLSERWRVYLQSHSSSNNNNSDHNFSESVLSRILWIPPLNPTEYLILLAIGDVMIDPFPFGGGVTTLESLAMCTPVVTLPSEQTVPALATGMLRAMQLSQDVEKLLIAESVSHYLQSMDSLLSIRYNDTERVRMEMCQNHFRIFEQKDTLTEWNKFLRQLINTVD